MTGRDESDYRCKHHIGPPDLRSLTDRSWTNRNRRDTQVPSRRRERLGTSPPFKDRGFVRTWGGVRLVSLTPGSPRRISVDSRGSLLYLHSVPQELPDRSYQMLRRKELERVDGLVPFSSLLLHPHFSVYYCHIQSSIETESNGSVFSRHFCEGDY